MAGGVKLTGEEDCEAAGAHDQAVAIRKRDRRIQPEILFIALFGDCRHLGRDIHHLVTGQNDLYIDVNLVAFRAGGILWHQVARAEIDKNILWRIRPGEYVPAVSSARSRRR